MAKCRRPLPAESQRILQEMTRDLRDRLRAVGWTHSALADRIRCDRSRVSHALAASGEELPPRRLIRLIADALDARAAELGLPPSSLAGVTLWHWYQASHFRSIAVRREREERRRAVAKEVEGARPASMETHQDLLRALNALVTARFGSQRAMCRARSLSRPAVSAALSDRRSLSIGLMDKILRACGVRGTDQQAWRDAWGRLAGPRQQAALERQRAGYDLGKHGRCAASCARPGRRAGCQGRHGDAGRGPGPPGRVCHLARSRATVPPRAASMARARAAWPALLAVRAAASRAASARRAAASVRAGLRVRLVPPGTRV